MIVTAIVGFVAVISLVVGLTKGGSSQTAPTDQNPFTDSQSVGSAAGAQVLTNVYWFPKGIIEGRTNVVSNQDVINIAAGQNQGAWLNTTGQTVTVDQTEVFLYGTSSASVASTTVALSVGTSTTATVTDSFTWGTSAFWAQNIDYATIATSTPTPSGTGFLVADNITNHKTNKPGSIQVNPGQYLLAVFSTGCKNSTTSGCGDTATSSARGWDHASISFQYRY